MRWKLILLHIYLYTLSRTDQPLLSFKYFGLVIYEFEEMDLSIGGREDCTSTTADEEFGVIDLFDNEAERLVSIATKDATTRMSLPRMPLLKIPVTQSRTHRMSLWSLPITLNPWSLLAFFCD